MLLKEEWKELQCKMVEISVDIALFISVGAAILSITCLL